MVPRKGFNMQRLVETGSRSIMSYLHPKLMKSERSAVRDLPFKDNLKDLYQSYKHMRLMSVFCTRVCLVFVDACWLFRR